MNRIATERIDPYVMAFCVLRYGGFCTAHVHPSPDASILQQSSASAWL
jgi:hypothetical protein